MKTKNNKKSRKVISLFSGAMGLDLGLISAGLEIALSQDYDKKCVKTIEKNGHKALGGDIREVIKKDPSLTNTLGMANLKKEEVFAIVGGPPCQAYSTAGKRLGTTDERGSLYREFIYCIDKIQPRFFVMENVRGLLSIKKNPAEENSPMLLDHILEEFKKIGYKTVHKVLDAVDYGAPQFRERLIIVGTRDDEPIFIPKPTHFQTHQNPAMRWRTLANAISDLDSKKMRYSNFSPNIHAVMKLIPEGQNWRALPIDQQKKAMGGAFESGGGKSGFFRRLNSREPSPTLVTSPVQKATLLGHPTEHRPLSVEEYARIQGFPDKWIIEGTVADGYRQLGNAVPVPLGRAIGEMLVSVAEMNYQIDTKRR